MSAQVAPYNDSMRIGSGFNSYTQQLRVNDAVIKENKTSATDKDLKPKLTGNADTISQQVTFTSKFVDHASEITEAMNISGALEIKYQGMGAKASGAYVDSSKVKDSDINYFVQVKVVNQQLIADDATKFNVIPNIPVTDQQRFTDVYGDSYVSGFLEGGEFNALLSVKVNDKENTTDIKGALAVSLEKAGFGISGEAEGEYKKANIAKNSETSITVSWTGGGDIRDEADKGKGWTIDSMAKAAFGFADRVRHTPQRTHAILTKYTALRSYQLLSNKGSPLDYENAGVYTNSLLEHYLDYKDIWKKIGIMSADYGQNKTFLTETSTAVSTAEEIAAMKEEFQKTLPKIDGKEQDLKHIPEHAYDNSLVGLEKARRDCRLQMIRVVKEVDAVAEDPKVAIDFDRVGQYLSPVLFRQLLPGVEPRPTEEEIDEEKEKLAAVEDKMAELQDEMKSLRESVNASTSLFDNKTFYSITTKDNGYIWAICHPRTNHNEKTSSWKFIHKGDGEYQIVSQVKGILIAAESEPTQFGIGNLSNVTDWSEPRTRWLVKKDGSTFTIESVFHKGYAIRNYDSKFILSKEWRGCDISPVTEGKHLQASNVKENGTYEVSSKEDFISLST